MTYATKLQSLKDSIGNLLNGFKFNHQVLFDDKLSLIRLNKDSNDIFTRVEYRRADNTLAKLDILSGGTSPDYSTRTLNHYDTDGTTVLKTFVYSLTYTNNVLTSETLISAT